MHASTALRLLTRKRFR